MQRRKRRKSTVHDEHGATLAFVAIALVALMAAVAFVVDMGMLFVARNEAQRAADAGAHAGAVSLLYHPGDENRAREKAIEVGDQNAVLGEAAGIREEDVIVDLDDRSVRVIVRRDEVAGGPVPTWFARALGIDEVPVNADAKARIGWTNSTTCLKPWLIADASDDIDGDGAWTDGEDYYCSPMMMADGECTDHPDAGIGTEVTSWGSGFRDATGPSPTPDDTGIDPAGTYYKKDSGKPIVLKPGNPNEAMQPGWFYPIDLPREDEPDVGGARYKENILSCNPTTVTIGDYLWKENGNMIGPTQQGVQALIDQDPNATWDQSCNDGVGCIVNSDFEKSPRYVVVPTFAPTQPVPNGKTEVQINSLVGFFLEDLQGNDVIGRFMGATGIGSGEPLPETTVLFVQLVE